VALKVYRENKEKHLAVGNGGNTVNVENVPIAEIKPFWRNPRDNRAAVDAVKQSIENYGFNVPLVIDAKGVIITGHTRYLALTQLGYETVPCIRATHLSEKKAREYRLADNATAEMSSWDHARLMAELRELDADAMTPFFSRHTIKQALEHSTGADYITPDDEVIATAGQAIATEHEERSQVAQDDYVDLTCPKCGGLFAVSKEDFRRRFLSD
jgi:hypothetical protein